MCEREWVLKRENHNHRSPSDVEGASLVRVGWGFMGMLWVGFHSFVGATFASVRGSSSENTTSSFRASRPRRPAAERRERGAPPTHTHRPMPKAARRPKVKFSFLLSWRKEKANRKTANFTFHFCFGAKAKLQKAKMSVLLFLKAKPPLTTNVVECIACLG